MNQILIGSFIAKKRREKMMTQVQLAEQLGVSDKTISKWETGKCMPDYGVIKPLCQILDISIAELMDGEEAPNRSDRTYDDSQILNLIKRTQLLEQQRTELYGLILLIMGTALLTLHYNIGGSGVKDFISGFLLGLSIVEMLVGVYMVARGIWKR